MTAFTHTWGDDSIERSFNKHFLDKIDDALPTWMTSAAAVNFDWPRTPLAFPSFSVVHFGSDEVTHYQGEYVEAQSGTRYKGVKKVKTAEISCWIRRDTDASWKTHLRQMGDMVQKLFRTQRFILILDAYNSEAATGTIIRISSVQQTETQPDQGNTNVERARYIVTYWWVERWAA
jgi:hypothetical protein